MTNRQKAIKESEDRRDAMHYYMRHGRYPGEPEPVENWTIWPWFLGTLLGTFLGIATALGWF